MIGTSAEAGRSRVPLAERIHPAARTRLDVRERAGLQVIEARLPGPFRAFFTTRLGGFSMGPFTSLNLDLRSSDDRARVRRNRGALVAALAGEPSEHLAPAESLPGRQEYQLVSPRQVHGARVTGTAEYLAAHEGAEFTDPCDGLTLHPLLDERLAALLLFADCVPVVLVGDVDMAVVHAGWRGMLGGVIEQAGCAMTGPPGLAVIGPSLGPCCFTVGVEVAADFERRFGPRVVGEGRVDLWGAATVALRELGVAPSRIVNPRLCTACNRDLFYSYRAEGPETGRHGCVAWTAGS